MRIYVLVSILLVLLRLVVAAASILPSEVQGFARQHSCAEVVGFNERPGMVAPSYLYGYMRDMGRDESVVFWCQSEADPKPYKLILHIKGDSDAACSGIIYETKDFPGGLSFESFQGDLNVDGYRQLPSKTCGSEGILVKSFYDGMGVTFTFKGGTWFAKMWD